MWAMASSRLSTTRRETMRSRYSVSQSSAVASRISGSSVRVALQPRISTPALRYTDASMGKNVWAMHQDRLDRIAHCRVLHLGVITHRHSPREIGVLVNIGVAQTFRVPQHGHTRVFLNVAHKRIAATWDKQVDVLIECQQGVDILTRLDHLYGLGTGSVNAGDSITNELPEHTVRSLCF